MPGIRKEDDWIFNSANGQITIPGFGEQISRILEACNGFNSEAAILEYIETGGDSELAQQILSDLKEVGILTESREQSQQFHELTKNPSRFSRNLTTDQILEYTYADTYVEPIGRSLAIEVMASKVIELSAERLTCRNFSQQVVEFAKISTCLAAAYSQEIKPVPSGGGLYPLRTYLLQVKGGAELPEGIYEFNHKNDTLVEIANHDDTDWEKFKFIFADEEILGGAPNVVVIAADIRRHPGKYSNRGYRYTVLEAGHAAQNIHLAAQELGLGVFEYGGFNDEALKSELGMSERIDPMIAIGIGYRGERQPNVNFDALRELENEYVGPGKPIKWANIDVVSDSSKQLNFFVANAEYIAPNADYSGSGGLFSFGTAYSPELAKIKAIAEANERYVAGKLKFDIKSSAANLDGQWLDPRSIRLLTDEQYDKHNYIDRFSEDIEIEWILGKQTDGSDIYVPIDLVFYPLDKTIIKRKIIADADSSGMAAYPDKQIAIRRALLELIERDATMSMWLKKEAPNRISTASLPLFAKNRVEFWRTQDRRVEVLNLSHDDIPIFNVIIRSENDFPFMVSGAAASDNDSNEALRKAFQEAELGYSMAQNMKNRPTTQIEPKDVFSPEDHGKFYYLDTYKTEVEWLWSSGFISYDTLSAKSPTVDIIDKYNPISVDLSQDGEPLSVVRVLCPELVPINFGFGNEHYSHPAIGLKSYSPAAPHFFA